MQNHRDILGGMLKKKGFVFEQTNSAVEIFLGIKHEPWSEISPSLPRY